jgi:SAM-dependent methyltransferase
MRSFLTKNMALRRVEPEILDALPANDPEAIGSRRDLVWINALMSHASLMARTFERHVQTPPQRILEIGSGEGNHMLAVARRMAARWPNVELVLVDMAPVVPPRLHADFEKLGWRMTAMTADVFDFVADDANGHFDLVAANLFLHHFTDAQLVRLFRGLRRRAPLLVATEPCRAAFPLGASGLLRLVGANRVTLHDAAVSIRAAFTGQELSTLWRAAGGEPLEERRAGLFSHLFVGAGEAKAQ